MNKLLPILLLVAWFIPVKSMCQGGLPYEVKFLDDQFDLDKEDPGASAGDDHRTNDLFHGPERIIKIHRTTGFKKVNQNFFFYAKDVSTGQQGNKGSFDPKWDIDTWYDHLSLVNERLFMIYETVDKKSGLINVFAWEIDQTQLQPAAAPKKIGSISFDPKSLSWPGRLGAKLITSEDGNFTAFFFDGIRTKEDEQLVLVTMLDKDLETVWAQGYHLQIESDKLRTVGVSVGNNGTVYMLANGTIRKKSDANPLKGFQLLALDKEDMVIEKVSLPGDNRPMNADLALSQGKTPVVGGFYQGADSPQEETRGYYIAEYNADVSAPVEADLRTFSKALETRIEVPRMLARSDGGLFLTGEGKRIKGIAVAQEYLFAAQLANDGEQVWQTLVPRALYASKSDEDYGSRSLLFDDQLVMLAPDNEENVANYRSRSELNAVRKGAENVLAFTFGEQGEFSAQLFAPAVEFRLSVGWQPHDLLIGPSTYKLSGSKKAGKKWTYGSIFLTKP